MSHSASHGLGCSSCTPGMMLSSSILFQAWVLRAGTSPQGCCAGTQPFQQFPLEISVYSYTPVYEICSRFLSGRALLTSGQQAGRCECPGMQDLLHSLLLQPWHRSGTWIRFSRGRRTGLCDPSMLWDSSLRQGTGWVLMALAAPRRCHLDADLS